MKKTLTLLFIAVSFLTAQAQPTVIFQKDTASMACIFQSPYEIKKNNMILKEVVTYGKVVQVVYDFTKDGKNTPYAFINLEKKYPNNPIALIVFKPNFPKEKFETLKQTLVGKTIFAYGGVEFLEQFRRKDVPLKPTIIIKNPNQIKITTDF